MDYAFFESLSIEEAQQFLSRFLETEGRAARDLVLSARQAGLSADFQLGSLVPMLSWIVGEIRTIPVEPDNSLPEWIRGSDSYIHNLFDFDDLSKVLVLRGAYYLGETFIRSCQGLSWTIGNSETAFGNMPVVHGFLGGLEMAPMVILENTFGRILSGRGSKADLEEMVSYWASRAKQSYSSG